VTEALLGFLGVLAGGILTYLGVKFTAKQNARAAQDATLVSNRQVDITEWQTLVGALRDEVNRLAGRVDALEQKREDDRDYIETLEAKDRAHEARYRTLVRYTRALIEWARRVEAPPENPPPTFPEALREDLAP